MFKEIAVFSRNTSFVFLFASWLLLPGLAFGNPDEHRDSCLINLSTSPTTLPLIFRDDVILDGIEIEPDPLFEKQTLSRSEAFEAFKKILKMAGQARKRSLSDLKLAHKLPSGYHIEFQYTRDDSESIGAKDQILKLTSISLNPPSATPITLTNTPLTDDANALMQRTYIWSTVLGLGEQKLLISSQAVGSKEIAPVVEANFPQTLNGAIVKPLYHHDAPFFPFDYLKMHRNQLTESDRNRVDDLERHLTKLSVPLKIKGPVLKRFNRWLPVINFVFSEELRKIDSESSIYKLWLNGAVRFSGDYLKNLSLTRFVNFALIGMSAFAFQRVWHQIPPENRSFLPQIPTLSDSQSKQVYTFQNRLFRFNQLFRNIDPDWQRRYPEIVLALMKLDSGNPNFELQTSPTFLIPFFKNENDLKGRVITMNFSINFEETPNTEHRERPALAMINYFEKTDLITITLLPTDDEYKFPMDTVVIKNTESNTQMFHSIVEMMKSKAAAEKPANSKVRKARP